MFALVYLFIDLLPSHVKGKKRWKKKKKKKKPKEREMKKEEGVGGRRDERQLNPRC